MGVFPALHACSWWTQQKHGLCSTYIWYVWIKLLLLIKRRWISNYYIIHLDQNSQAYSHSTAHMHRNQRIENKGVQLKKKTNVPRENFYSQTSFIVYSTHTHKHTQSDLKSFMSSIELDTLQQGNIIYPQSHIEKQNHKWDLCTIWAVSPRR